MVGNNTFGVAITQNPLGSPDQIPNGHQVRLNVVVDNGTKASNGLPGADLFYDGSGQDNCFARNRFTTAVPPNIEASFPCH